MKKYRNQRNYRRGIILTCNYVMPAIWWLFLCPLKLSTLSSVLKLWYRCSQEWPGSGAEKNVELSKKINKNKIQNKDGHSPDCQCLPELCEHNVSLYHAFLWPGFLSKFSIRKCIALGFRSSIYFLPFDRDSQGRHLSSKHAIIILLIYSFPSHPHSFCCIAVRSHHLPKLSLLI